MFFLFIAFISDCDGRSSYEGGRSPLEKEHLIKTIRIEDEASLKEYGYFTNRYILLFILFFSIGWLSHSLLPSSLMIMILIGFLLGIINRYQKKIYNLQTYIKVSNLQSSSLEKSLAIPKGTSRSEIINQFQNSIKGQTDDVLIYRYKVLNKIYQIELRFDEHDRVANEANIGVI